MRYFVLRPVGFVERAPHWGRGTEKGDGLLQVGHLLRCPGRREAKAILLSPLCHALCMCVCMRAGAF